MAETEITNGSMPPKVAGAITAVMKAVPKLKKGEKNTHGNYNFASIDDFLEAVRPLCAEHGLIIMQDEESFETQTGTDKNGKAVSWLVMRFRFTLAHSSGEVWSHQPARTIMVSAAMGAQAFGAAQSYALKQFMRSLFQIATGEKGMDADEHAPADLPDSKRGNGSTAKSGTKTADKAAAKKLVSEILACDDLTSLVCLQVSDDFKHAVNGLRSAYPDGYDAVVKEGSAQRVRLVEAEAKQGESDPFGDGEPEHAAT